MLCEIYCILRRVTMKEWPVHERIELPHLIRRTGHHVYHSTGFDREEIIDLCIRVNSVERETGTPGWPPCLGLFKSVVVALTYMRHNRTQAEIGESLGVSQPTISRAVSAITPLIPEAYANSSRPLTTLTRMPSTSWTAHCSHAGHGPDARDCTWESTKPPA
jgi:Helix-turn-helix of DDE superfamily endonuclease